MNLKYENRMVFDMENIINKLNETELELLIKVCEDYVNNMGSLSDEVIEELSEEEDRLERLHDMSDLNTESDVVKEALEIANSYAVIVKTLVNQGINYSDAIILGNTYVSSKIEKEIREIDSIALKNNMV